MNLCQRPVHDPAPTRPRQHHSAEAGQLGRQCKIHVAGRMPAISKCSFLALKIEVAQGCPKSVQTLTVVGLSAPSGTVAKRAGWEIGCQARSQLGILGVRANLVPAGPVRLSFPPPSARRRFELCLVRPWPLWRPPLA